MYYNNIYYYTMKNILFLLIIIFLLSSCSRYEKHKNEIQKLFQTSKYFEMKGDLENALIEYKKLIKYKDKKAYIDLEVEKILNQRGWSESALEESYTLKLMTILQNKINIYVTKEGKFPNMELPSFSFNDYWGNPFKFAKRTSVRHRGVYDYWLKSAGPDGKWESPDDMALVNKAIIGSKKKKDKKKKVKQKVKGFERLLDLEKVLDNPDEKNKK